MKKILTILLALLLLTGVAAGLASCGAEREPAPDIDEVYDRLVQVIEASHEVNVLLFGAGLPVYPRGDAEDELLHRYYGVADNGREFVTPYAKYATVAEMQAAIAAVYSTEYRESLYESLFTGYAADEMSVIMPARFSEDERFLYMSKYVDPLVEGVRVYDYASMEIVEYSHASRLRVSINSYSEKYPDQWKRVYLSFVYENGDWYLDSPSC
jgi:hypothetical protein